MKEAQCVYMALVSLDPTGKGRKKWTMRWKAPLNAFQIAFEGRSPRPPTEPTGIWISRLLDTPVSGRAASHRHTGAGWGVVGGGLLWMCQWVCGGGSRDCR
jgi:hypothetical protein